MYSIYNHFIGTYIFIAKIGSGFIFYVKVNSDSSATQSLICPWWAV